MRSRPLPRQTVELEERLGGQAAQHREVQGHESDKFMSYFPDGVTYMSGGVDSAFVHVDKSAFEPCLLHVKGRKNVRSRQVPLVRASLNDGDVFILDAGTTIYQVRAPAPSAAQFPLTTPPSSTASRRRAPRRQRRRRSRRTSRTWSGAARRAW